VAERPREDLETPPASPTGRTPSDLVSGLEHARSAPRPIEGEAGAGGSALPPTSGRR